MICVRFAAIAAVLVATAGRATAMPALSGLFGSRVSENTRFKAPYMTADLDGDGVQDPLYLVSLAPAKPRLGIAKDVTMLPDLFHSQPLGNHAQSIALAIALGGRKYLITDFSNGAGFFDSPSWSADPIPLTIAKRGSAAFKHFQQLEPRIKHDVVILGTEAGIDIALYWNGKSFALYWPAEEP